MNMSNNSKKIEMNSQNVDIFLFSPDGQSKNYGGS